MCHRALCRAVLTKTKPEAPSPIHRQKGRHHHHHRNLQDCGSRAETGRVRLNPSKLAAPIVQHKSGLSYTFCGQSTRRLEPRTTEASNLYHDRSMATSASWPQSWSSIEKDSESWHPPRPRRFLPLNPARANDVDTENLPRLRGIIFDVDGTLCLPQNYMFREMRAALNIPKSTDILDHIRQLPSEPDQTTPASSSPQSRAQEIIRGIERDAMSSQRPQPGLVELMTYLEQRSIPKALCTRNFPAPVHHLIDTFLGDLKDGFDMIVTRETERIAPKPSPEGLWAIAKNWNLHADSDVSNKGTSDVLERARKQLGSGLIMVGDSIDDMAAGYRAGAATVLLLNEDNQWLAEHNYVDRPIVRLDELADILENGFQGKD